MPFTSRWGETYCCPQFVNWMASSNGYHQSGKTWHGTGCDGFLPEVEYAFGNSSLIVRATSPDSASVVVTGEGHELMVRGWLPYHHACVLASNLMLTLTQVGLETANA